MKIPFNTSGMPKGTGSLQVRGRVYWAIYTDQFGRIQQVNTKAEGITEARRFLAALAIEVLQARLAAVQGVLDEGQGKGHHSAGAEAGRPQAGRGAKAASGNRQKTSQGGTR